MFLLERLGHEVVFPAGQVCCGQMHVNTGYLKEAVPVVRHHVEVFTAADFDVAVAPSGSCVGSVRHQHAMVARRAGDTALAERATALAGRTYELSELLVDVLGRDRRRRVLPAPGHLPPDLPFAADAAGRRQAAAAAAGGRRGSTWSSCPRREECCGFGGTFALKNSDTSSAMLADKISNVLSHRRRGLHRRRLVLPDAHRRRPVPRGDTGSAPCTSRRSWPRREENPA